METAEVARFYDRSLKWFRYFYADRVSLGFHYGLWLPGTRNRSDALANQYRELADRLSPQEGMRILDAGCGIGGACLWLADRTMADFVGITISPRQLKVATLLAKRRGLTYRAHFDLQNFSSTSYADGSFDAAFGIESLCHAYPNPAATYRELFRILRPGGRLVISDGILRRKPATSGEQELADRFARGYAMEGWCTGEEVEAALGAAGFASVKREDRTPVIEPSVREIDRRTKQLGPILELLGRMHLISREELGGLDAARAQGPLYDTGLFGYVTVTAIKPGA